MRFKTLKKYPVEQRAIHSASVSREVLQHVRSRGRHDEAFEDTLRRLLKMDARKKG